LKRYPEMNGNDEGFLEKAAVMGKCTRPLARKWRRRKAKKRVAVHNAMVISKMCHTAMCNAKR
jgi:hypothetical protein